MTGRSPARLLPGVLLGRIAVLAKTTRNAMIGFVVLLAAWFFAAREGRRLWRPPPSVWSSRPTAG